MISSALLHRVGITTASAREFIGVVVVAGLFELVPAPDDTKALLRDIFGMVRD
ncbi:MAG: hypothetical protein HC908_11515 [Calothrix sp. SM1_7_51]|nr:hypothetical protein [Calothrix sp. SM1_7_51]